MRGFTLVEILLALAIGVIISVVSVHAFSRFNEEKALIGETQKVVSLLTRARTLTLAAKESSTFGVHVEESSVVLFKGPLYVNGNSENTPYKLHTRIRVSSLTLAGGGSEIIFKKLTGTTEQSGTITLSVVGNDEASSTVTVLNTGVAYNE